jgi:hypothetical protein
MVMYNGSLTIYYLLVIVKNRKDASIAKFEPYLHFFPLSIAIAISSAAVALGMINLVGWDSWIGPALMGCDESHKLAEGDANDDPCDRGDGASLFTWYFYYAPL